MNIRHNAIALALALAAGLGATAQTLSQARTWYARGEYAKAKPVFRKYVRSQPGNGNYNLWYGVCCLYTGEEEAAVSYLENAVKRRIPSGQLYLTQAYNAVYRFDEAVETCEAYLSDLQKRKRDTAEAESLLKKSRQGRDMMRGVEQVCVIDSFVVDKASFLQAYRISPESGRVSFARNTLETADGADGTVYETELSDLRFYSATGQEIDFEYVTMDHGAVDVTLTVYKTAQLPINVRFVNTPPNFDDSVLIYSLSQTALRVAGPAATVDNLTELAVGTIDLSTFALDKVYEMPITLPSGIVSLDNVDTVTVSFNCSAMATKTLNVPAENVEVINLPSTYQLAVESDRLMNVTLCGPAAVLEGLTADQVVARIDADDFAVALGQQNIACSIYVPADGRVFALGSYTIQCEISSE